MSLGFGRQCVSVVGFVGAGKSEKQPAAQWSLGKPWDDKIRPHSSASQHSLTAPQHHSSHPQRGETAVLATRQRRHYLHPLDLTMVELRSPGTISTRRGTQRVNKPSPPQLNENP
ncbi:hypothetical protein DQ04_03261000, partial [Trypanosoma grayi]|uniref:hypothetical protein n=1 Tax=Trypanosoma grayi TaxID=71804 RepID=UPI0004F4B072